MKFKRLFPFVLAIIIVISIGLYFYCSTQKIDINSLSSKELYVELESINGVGEIMSERCVEYINENRPVKLKELINIDGIGEKKLELIKQKFKD